MSPQTSLLDVYCIDTSVFLDIWNGDLGSYPKELMPDIWEGIMDTLSEGRLVSTIEVYDEIKDDIKLDFVKWVTKNKNIFLPLSMNQIDIVKEIVNKYPKSVQKKNNADPFVVALAKVNGFTVLTSEKKSGGKEFQPKIPDLCEEYGVPYVNVLSFCKREGILPKR